MLSDEEMVKMLIEIHLLESNISLLRVNQDSSQVLYNSFEKILFEEKGVDYDQYLKTYKYYLEDVSHMERIYEIVVDSLNLREKSFSSPQNPKK